MLTEKETDLGKEKSAVTPVSGVFMENYENKKC